MSMNTGHAYFDILIAGAGPAGAMAALSARQAAPDLSVGIVDRKTEIRPRIGEALLTGTIMTLDDAGLTQALAAEGFHKKIGAAYVWGENREPWYVNYPPADEPYPDQFTHETGRYAVHVDRPKFDAFLRRHALAADAEIIDGQISRVNFADTGRALHADLTDGTRIRFRHFIDATGQAAMTGTQTGMRVPVGARRVARYGYTQSIDWDKAERHGFGFHRTNIVSSANGWIWVIHLGDAGHNLTSVGVVCFPEVARRLTPGNIHEAFPELTLFGLERGLSDVSDANGRRIDRLIAHADYGFACERLDGPNWALAGDAAIFVDPILSQGVTLALHYGRLRGRAAAASILGASGEPQSEVTMHYRREGLVLREIVDTWYDNNRSIAEWQGVTRRAAEDCGLNTSGERAFRFVTNLENIRNEYDPFPDAVRRHIDAKLGVTTGSGASSS